MDQARFLFVSQGALIGDIAWQVSKEGHAVRYFIGTESERDIADGFVPKTTDWKKDVDWADVIVFDDTLGRGRRREALRARARRWWAARRTPTGWRTTARSARRSSRRPASPSSPTRNSTTSPTPSSS